jgi:hypothetical protein
MEEMYVSGITFIRYVSGITFIRYVSRITFIRYVSGITFIMYVSGITFIRYVSIPLWYPYFEISYYLLTGIEKVTVLNSFYFHTHDNDVTITQQYRDGGYFLKIMKTMFLHKQYEFSA